MSCASKLLLYYVVRNSRLAAQISGVRGMPLHSLAADELNLIYSPIVPPQEFTRDDALSFHSVLNQAFAQQAILPFRFPTLLQNIAELQAHLQQKHGAYSADLRHLENMVQMELRIAARQQETAPARSGTEYLHSRQQHARTLQNARQEARTALGDLIMEWKERPTDQGLRCYALIERDRVTDFRRKVEGADFNGPFSILLSGPWPPTEFLHD